MHQKKILIAKYKASFISCLRIFGQIPFFPQVFYFSPIQFGLVFWYNYSWEGSSFPLITVDFLKKKFHMGQILIFIFAPNKLRRLPKWAPSCFLREWTVRCSGSEVCVHLGFTVLFVKLFQMWNFCWDPL